MNRDVETIITGDTDSDFVKVVRCQNCVHHYNGNCFRIEKVTLSVNADDYCSRGERKEIG